MNHESDLSAVRRANRSMSLKPAISVGNGSSGHSTIRSRALSQGGLLILNADDWGRDHETTERTLKCVRAGTVSSVSAMVFMADSERAAAIGCERGIDAGLHLNLTTPFSGPGTPVRLAEHQQRLSRYLRRHRLAQIVFNPCLASSFEYVVTTQFAEFRRLYGSPPSRIDGHHHMHLCTNVLFGNLLPAGTIVRRNFSFQAEEKGLCNRLYRRVVDRILARRHHLTDFFFCLQPLDSPGHLSRIFSLASEFTIEVEAHPVNPDEYRFLLEGEISRWAGDLQIAADFALPLQQCRPNEGNL